MMKAVAAAAGIVALIVLGFVLVTAEGSPSAPTMVNQNALTPGSAQTISITISSQFYSLQVPNSIDLQGQKAVYSAWQNGKLLVAAQTIALGVTGSSGWLYTVSAVITLSVPALCATSGCTGVTDNVTVSAYVLVPAYTGLYQSPTVNETFSNVAVYNGDAAPGPNPVSTPVIKFGTFGINFLVVLLFFFAVIFALVLAFTPARHPAIAAADGVFFILGFVLFLIFAFAGI